MIEKANAEPARNYRVNFSEVLLDLNLFSTSNQVRNKLYATGSDAHKTL